MNLKDNLRNATKLQSNRLAVQQTNVAKTFRSIPVSDLYCEDQVRTTFSEIEELADSMKSVGQQQPITVAYNREKGKYLIIQGERRYRAAIAADLKSLEAIILATPPMGTDRSIAQLTENLARDSMNPFDVAVALSSILERTPKLNREELGKKLGLSRTIVFSYLKIAQLPEDITSQLKESNARDVVAIANLAKAYEANESKTRLFLKTCENGITRNATQALLDNINGKTRVEEGAPEPATPTTTLKPKAAVSLPKGFISKSLVLNATGIDQKGKKVSGTICLNAVDKDGQSILLKVQGKLVPVSIDSVRLAKV